MQDTLESHAGAVRTGGSGSGIDGFCFSPESSKSGRQLATALVLDIPCMDRLPEKPEGQDMGPS